MIKYGDPYWIMDLHNNGLFMDLHNWIMDLHKNYYGTSYSCNSEQR